MGHIYRIMKDDKVIDRTKKKWNRKYSKIEGCTLWEWQGKGMGWKIIPSDIYIGRRSKKKHIKSTPIMEPSMCITEADRILYRINMRLEEIHRKRKVGVA